MAFNIVLQTNNSEKNRVDKDITNVVTLTGTLKEQSSIIDPVILITADLSVVKNVNYMTIETFGRSYFVNEIVSVTNDLIKISGHVDVLSSFKAGIRANTAIISRQKTEYNLYLNDGSFKVYQNPMVLTQPFTNGFSSLNYILAIAGG